MLYFSGNGRFVVHCRNIFVNVFFLSKIKKSRTMEILFCKIEVGLKFFLKTEKKKVLRLKNTFFVESKYIYWTGNCARFLRKKSLKKKVFILLILEENFLIFVSTINIAIKYKRSRYLKEVITSLISKELSHRLTKKIILC